MNKIEIRKKALTVRKNIPSANKEKASLQIYKQCMNIVAQISPSIVCLYISLPDEVDTHVLLKELKKCNIKVVAPKVEADRLVLYNVDSFMDLSIGMFNIYEPVHTITSYDPSTIDCFIVPGIAFDMYGHRIGWGKGLYDSLLQTVTAPKIGLAFSEQIFPLLPHESYDIVMDVIITEREVYEIKKSS